MKTIFYAQTTDLCAVNIQNDPCVNELLNETNF